MQRNYWERIAPEYDEEIFDVLKNDQKKRILKTLESVAGKNRQVVDIGCAVGKWLAFLSAHFKSVDALDISARNLAIAKKTTRRSEKRFLFQRRYVEARV